MWAEMGTADAARAEERRSAGGTAYLKSEGKIESRTCRGAYSSVRTR